MKIPKTPIVQCGPDWRNRPNLRMDRCETHQRYFPEGKGYRPLVVTARWPFPVGYCRCPQTLLDADKAKG